MNNSLWKKAARDLWGNRGRTALILLSLTVGVFAVAVVADSYAILLREMDTNYLRTDPASATLWVTPLTETDLERFRSLPGIAAADVRATVNGRLESGEHEWKPITLFVIPDFDSMPLDRIFPESGAWPPGEGEVLIERAAMSLTSAAPGDLLRIRIPGGTGGDLLYAGTAHAPGLAPAWMENEVYGFITPATLARLGGTPAWQELRVTFTDPPAEQEAVRVLAAGLTDTLRAEGYAVSRVEVPVPAKHPHATQMATLLMLLEAFGVLALALSCVLAANMISAMMAREVRQIGVMKTLGGSPAQVGQLYLAMVGGLGALAMLIALPLGWLAARAYAQVAAEMLNFTIFREDIPLSYVLLQVAIGVLLPLVVASAPIARGSAIPIREALADYGVGVLEFGLSTFDRLLAALSILPQSARMATRNAFRRRTRALLTILTLAAAGACFITARNVSASMDGSVDDRFAAIRYDTQIIFNRPYPLERLETGLAGIPGLERAEYWGGARTEPVRVDGSTGSAFMLIAPDPDSELITSLPVAEGRWFDASGGNELVINQVVAGREPDARVGATLRLRINGRESEWTVTGVVREILSPATAYASREALNRAAGLEGTARIVSARAKDRGPEGAAALARAYEARMESEGFDPSNLIRLEDWRTMILNHLLLLASFLLLMSALVLIVGGLGLASTLSINVLERRREIGVMRATGASGWDVAAVVAGEGLMLGWIGWILAVLIADPAGRWISWNFGMTFFDAPLTFSYSLEGAAQWLVIVTVFAALASLLPAWDASRHPVQEALAYE